MEAVRSDAWISGLLIGVVLSASDFLHKVTPLMLLASLAALGAVWLLSYFGFEELSRTAIVTGPCLIAFCFFSDKVVSMKIGLIIVGFGWLCFRPQPRRKKEV